MVDIAKLCAEDEPIRTGRSLRERRPGGKLYAVNPEAVARLKATLAERERLEGAAVSPEKSDILGDLLRAQRERQTELNARKRKPEIPAEIACEWHIDFYQEGYSIKEVAELAGVGRNRLARRWRELRLPVSRKVEERFWRPEE
jgi:hypothetical protein